MGVFLPKCMNTDNTNMPNFLNPSSFVLTLDSQTYSGAEFTIQTMMLPDITADGADYRTLN